MFVFFCNIAELNQQVNPLAKMANKSDKGHHRNTIKCSDCQAISANPILGHFKCARHRLCSGANEWLPEACDVCMLLKFNYRDASDEVKVGPYEDLFKMLQETSDKLSDQDLTWEFENRLHNFLESQDTLADPNNELEEGELQEVPDNQEAGSTSQTIPGGETGQGGHIEELTARTPMTVGNPTSNELHSEVIGSLRELSGSIRLVLSHIQEQKDDNNKRALKRRHSPSSVYPEDYDDTEDNENFVNDNQNPYRSRSPSPHTSNPLAKRRRGRDFFVEGNNTIYFYTDNHRRVGNKVWFDGELRDVKWHRYIDAFSLINASSSENQFMSALQAHENLVSFFDATQDTSAKPGLARKCYRVPFDDSKGFGHALGLMQKESETLLHHLYTEDHKKFWNGFSNQVFKPASVVDFSSGWTLTNEKYMEWAKNEHLKTFPFSLQIQLNYTPFVPLNF